MAKRRICPKCRVQDVKHYRQLCPECYEGMEKQRKNPDAEELWTPFEKGAMTAESQIELRKFAEDNGVPFSQIAGAGTWVNNLYHVILFRPEDIGDRAELPDGSDEGVPRMLWLSIRRNDRGAAHDWRHLQRIKNEFLGPECEAVELFPAESRLVDTSNQYHLFGFVDSKHWFPFGFLGGRAVATSDDDLPPIGNAHQRALETSDGTEEGS